MNTDAMKQDGEGFQVVSFIVTVLAVFLAACPVAGATGIRIVERAQWHTGHGDPIKDLAAGDQLLFAACGRAGVRILDVADPAHPYELGIYQAGIDAIEVDVEGDLMVVAGLEDGLHFVDVSDPAQPVLLAVHAPTGSSARAVSLHEGRACVLWARSPGYWIEWVGQVGAGDVEVHASARVPASHLGAHGSFVIMNGMVVYEYRGTFYTGSTKCLLLELQSLSEYARMEVSSFSNPTGSIHRATDVHGDTIFFEQTGFRARSYGAGVLPEPQVAGAGWSVLRGGSFILKHALAGGRGMQAMWKDRLVVSNGRIWVLEVQPDAASRTVATHGQGRLPEAGAFFGRIAIRGNVLHAVLGPSVVTMEVVEDPGIRIEAGHLLAVEGDVAGRRVSTAPGVLGPWVPLPPAIREEAGRTVHWVNGAYQGWVYRVDAQGGQPLP